MCKGKPKKRYGQKKSADSWIILKSATFYENKSIVLQLYDEVAALTRRIDTLDNEDGLLRGRGILDDILQILNSIHRLVVDALDDEALRHTSLLHLAGIDLDNLQTIGNLQLLLLCLRHLTEVGSQHVEVGILHHLGVALLITKGY